jgi:hypothetical protein
VKIKLPIAVLLASTVADALAATDSFPIQCELESIAPKRAVAIFRITNTTKVPIVLTRYGVLALSTDGEVKLFGHPMEMPVTFQPSSAPYIMAGRTKWVKYSIPADWPNASPDTRINGADLMIRTYDPMDNKATCSIKGSQAALIARLVIGRAVPH